MTEIHPRLKIRGIKFVKLGSWDQSVEINGVKIYRGKAPFEKEWQKNGYEFDDEKLLEHLKTGKNYGVIGGFNNLRILDIDRIELVDEFKKKLDTFTVRTGSGCAHFYVFCDYDINHVLKDGTGEFRAKNYQVVGPSCRHPNGNYYTIDKDIEIKQVTKEEILEIIRPYLRNVDDTPTSKDVIKVQHAEDVSRSGLEFREVIRLIRKGHTKEEVFEIMMAFDKWKNPHHPSYREHTYKNALKWVEDNKGKNIQDTQLVPENQLRTRPISNYDMLKPEYSILKDSDLDSTTVEDTKWLVKNFIPKDSIVLIGGKSRAYKTTTLLHMAYCLATGKPLFNRHETMKSKVLYINEENSMSTFKPTAIAIRHGVTEQPTENLDYLNFSNIRLDTTQGFNEISKIIDDEKIEVIMVDTLKRTISMKEDSADEMNNFYNYILKPLRNKGVTIILLHHTKKDPQGGVKGDKIDMMRGSSELVNIADSVIFFRRMPGKTWFNVEQLKLRGRLEFPEMTIKIVGSNEEEKIELMDISEAESEEDNIEINECKENIVKIIQAGKKTEFKFKEIKEKMTGISGSNIVSQSLDSLISDKILDKPAHGVFTVNTKHQVFKGIFVKKDIENKEELDKKLI